MSAYDTVMRKGPFWVRYYCERGEPLAGNPDAVRLELGRDTNGSPVQFMSIDQARELGLALLEAAAKAAEIR